MQSIVVEFILTHVDQLFEGAALSGQCPSNSPNHHSLSGSHVRVIESLQDHLVQFPCFVDDRTESHKVLLLMHVEKTLQREWCRQDLRRPLLFSVQGITWPLNHHPSWFSRLVKDHSHPRPTGPMSWDLLAPFVPEDSLLRS